MLDSVFSGNKKAFCSGFVDHHPTLYIESSMGTGLVGKVYGVIRRYEGKGPH